MARKDEIVHDDGVKGYSLTPLLPSLQLPWDYEVLAAVLSPANSHRSAFVLLCTARPGDPQPYVVYRVDRGDGSCHGGTYCADYGRAVQVFAEIVCGIETAYCGSREVRAEIRGYKVGLAKAESERPVDEGSGLSVLRTRESLSAPQQIRRECWVSRAQISGNVPEQDHLPADTVEWQFADGPAGQRGYSEDFLSLEEGLREMSGAVVHWDPDNDALPEGYEVRAEFLEIDGGGWRGWVLETESETVVDTTVRLYPSESQALQSARDLAWELAPAVAAGSV